MLRLHRRKGLSERLIGYHVAQSLVNRDALLCRTSLAVYRVIVATLMEPDTMIPSGMHSEYRNRGNISAIVIPNLSRRA